MKKKAFICKFWSRYWGPDCVGLHMHLFLNWNWSYFCSCLQVLCLIKIKKEFTELCANKALVIFSCSNAEMDQAFHKKLHCSGVWNRCRKRDRHCDWREDGSAHTELSLISSFAVYKLCLWTGFWKIYCRLSDT